MSGTERVVQEPKGENLGVVFLHQVAESFNTILREKGVGPELRKEVLGSLVFELATRLEGQENVEFEGAAYTPVLCYRPEQEEGTLVYSPEFDYHDYAFPAVFNALEGETPG